MIIIGIQFTILFYYKKKKKSDHSLIFLKWEFLQNK
jgi:hypothetical protein